uniref:Uncharacterized protein n=1 Tax=Glossina austeni TaxID=7395 RepID=A0A1A9UKV8_GLOAU
MKRRHLAIKLSKRLPWNGFQFGIVPAEYEACQKTSTGLLGKDALPLICLDLDSFYIRFLSQVKGSVGASVKISQHIHTDVIVWRMGTNTAIRIKTKSMRCRFKLLSLLLPVRSVIK